MNKGLVVVATLLAFFAGLLLAYAPIIGDWVSAILYKAGLAPGSHAASTVTVTSVETVKKTAMFTETVTVPAITRTETIATTVTRTIYQTIYKTLSITETITTTITSTISRIQVINPRIYSALQELANGLEKPGPERQVYSINGVALYDGAYLVIHRPSYPGYYLATIYVYKSTGSESATGYYLVPCCVETPEMLPPSLLYIDEKGFTEYYSSESLEKLLGEGVYTIYIPLDENHAIECSIAVTQFYTRITGCTTIYTIVSGPRLNGYPSILDAVLGSYNETTLQTLRKIIYHNNPPQDSAEAVWESLAWIASHISYDYEKEEERNPSVYSPLQLIRLGRGVCSDYAVLEAAALLAAGEKTTYIIALETRPIPHAVAATWLDNTLLILDQHPPPIEVGDYAEYLLGNKSIEAYIIRIEKDKNLVRVKAYRAAIEPWLDTYPEDRLPRSLVNEVIKIVANTTKTKPAPELETVINAGHIYTYIDRYLEPLQGIGAQKPIPIGALYHPALDKQWAKTIAKTATKILEKYYPGAIGKGSFWLTISRTNNTTRIKLYATPFPEPRVATIETSKELTITIETQQPISPENTQLIIYTSNKPCAAIAPPGYIYTETPYITAKQWKTTGNKLVITIDKESLKNLTRNCNNPVLDIWLGNTIIYSIKINNQR